MNRKDVPRCETPPSTCGERSGGGQYTGDQPPLQSSPASGGGGQTEQVRERVEHAFRQIAATRMCDFPLSNPALRVELVGLRESDGAYVGVLITPWAINLLLLPGTSVQFRRLGPDQQQTWRFASGDYAFFGLEEDGIGAYQSCSLFSPALELRTHEAAAQIAQAVMLALFRPGQVDDREAPPQPVSRRDLLRGRLAAASPGV